MIMEVPEPIHVGDSNDLARLLQWRYADKYFLQATAEGFYHMLDGQRYKGRRRNSIPELSSEQLLDISKRALKNGEIDNAEKYAGKAIRKEKYEEDTSGVKNVLPYFYLAEALQKKASQETLQSPQRQKFLLQAASLYNFLKNYYKKNYIESESVTSDKNIISGKITNVQESLILATQGNKSRCRFNLESIKVAIKQLRKESKRDLEAINAKYDAETGDEEDLRKIFIKQVADVRNLYHKIASKVKQFFGEIIQECLEVLGEPPCEYEVIVLGSLAREEMTPYSDLEWAILTSSEDEQFKIFFRNLTNLVHLQIINLGETILPCMDIEVLREEWFYDDITPKGLSFDGFLDQASKTPLGNTKDFELIHSPTAMANFQCNFWYNKNPCIGEILLTFAPLDENRHVLLDEYKKELVKILREPCDLDTCAHDSLSARPTRGSCRGLGTLKEDIFRYKPQIMEVSSEYEGYFDDTLQLWWSNDDGKLLDVKKEIYRLTDRVVASLSNIFEVGGKGSFEALDKLCERNVISQSARDNVASAVAIALKMRLSTYLSAGKQEETIKGTTGNATSAYHVPGETELFHFFYVFTPLYESLCRLCDDFKNRSEDLAHRMFFSFTDAIKGHIHCRLLNYNAAFEHYKRALEDDPGNTSIQIRLKKIEAMLRQSKEDNDEERTDDGRDELSMHLLLSKFSEDIDFNKKKTEIRKKIFSIIKYEGISVVAIVNLNYLATLLISQNKKGEAYKCLQRAFIMEQTIFGDNPNLHAVLTSAFLGRLVHGLDKWDLSIFYFERSLKLLPSSEVGNNFTVMRREIYCNLATSYALKGNHEQAILYCKKGLSLAADSGKIFYMRSDCHFLCQMAMVCLIAGKDEVAMECVRKANETLTNAVENEESKVETTIHLALTYRSLGKSDEAKLLLLRGLGETQDEYKIKYLVSLGELCQDQGLTEEAEQHYKAVLNQRIETSKNEFDMVSTLLAITKIVIEKKRFSEAASYLQEAAKYLDHLSDLNDNDEKFKLLKKIAKRWEDLGEYKQAHMYLNKALEVTEESLLISEIEPRHEINLRIKLGDLVKKLSSVSLSVAGESSVTNEQVKHDQRKHYDQAYDLLQKHLATRILSDRSVDMLTDLARRYASIDLLKSEELLLNATKFHEIILEISNWGNINELSASILFTQGTVKFEKYDFVESLETFQQSLNMELEIHVSDPFHPHIVRYICNIPKLLSLIYNESCREVLETMKLKIFEFWEQHIHREMSNMSVETANCLINMANMCVYLKDYEKAEELNQIAFDIFAKTEGGLLKKLGIKRCHLTAMTLDYAKQRQMQNKPVTAKKLMHFGETIFPVIPCDTTSPTLVKKIVFNHWNAFDDSEFENEDRIFLSKAAEEVTQEDINQLIFDSLRSLNIEQGDKQDTEHCANAQRTRPSIVSEYHNACLLAESMLREGNNSYLGIKKTSFLSLVESLSGSPHCVQFFIKEAENARDEKNMYQMIIFLELASNQSSVPEMRAKIFKLVGECQLYLQSYRRAANNFTKAVEFYRSQGSGSKLDHKVDYIESLIGLAKSRMLCNEIENALCACDEGLEVQFQQTTALLPMEIIELTHLTLRCTPLLITSSTSQKVLKQCLERCRRIFDLTKTDLDLQAKIEAKYDISIIKASILSRLEKSELGRIILRLKKRRFIEKFTKFPASLRNNFHIGQVLIILGEMNDAVIHLTRSLADIFVLVFAGAILPLHEVIPLLDAITATNAVTSPEQESQSPFQQTLELCKHEYLKLNDNPSALLDFFQSLGYHYVDSERTEEAILAYEAGLEVVQYLILEATGQINVRGEMLLQLANVHRLQALKNTGEGKVEESRLAEKYYKYENGDGTENISIHKNIMYANFLFDEDRFEEAIVVLNQAIEAGDKLWSTTVVCLFSQRVLYGSDIEKCIESHGELLTNMGNLAYTSLVRAYVQLGNKKEASRALDSLLTNGEDLPPSSIYTTSCLSHFITICQKYLLFLIEDPMKLSFDDSEFPLSSGNLLKLLCDLGEYELMLILWTKLPFSPLSTMDKKEYLNLLSTLRLKADAIVLLKEGDKSFSFYCAFLLILDQREQILNKSFDEQRAMISQLSFPESKYVYKSLGKLMLEHQDKIDDAIACYEHCVGLDPGDDTNPDCVATLADLYQTKALTNGKSDKTIYQSWMDKAQECFQKLLRKNIKMTLFAETIFASFLLRTEQFAEAIFHFEQLLASEKNTLIVHDKVDIPLSGVHMVREIEAREEVGLPVKVYIYHQVVLAYFKYGKVEKAQEATLQMEEYVENSSFEPTEYVISRSMLAYTYKEIGNKVKAMEILKTVLETEPNNEPVKLALEECAAIEQTTSSRN